jgi:demethylmenaquinone methyltransferase/2-methoxy-6-polyprenyl-1,4-benzoquinol methylase
VDVSERMLREARGNLDIPVIQGHAEALPIADASVDFVSMGYALRHMADLACAFREFGRVLRPGGILLLLEIGRPSGRIVHAVAALYLGHAVPWLCRKFMPRTQMATLMQYYWDTIENCVPPDTILAGLSAAGFTDISCENSQGLFRAYRARKAYQGSVDSR